MKKEKIMIGDNLSTYRIIASEGKVLKRISDGYVFGSELCLGYTYYLNENKLATPLLERPEDFIEVDAPEEYLMNQEEYGNTK